MQHKNITTYLRQAVASYTNKKIDFKSDNFVIVTPDELYRGRCLKDVFNSVSKKKRDDEDEYESTFFCNIIIALKTIKTHFDGQERIDDNIDELTGVYFIPAKLDTSNRLSFDINKLPWIPRDFLEPMTEPILSLGKQSDYDALQSKFIGRKHTLTNWNDYLQFSVDFFDEFIKLDFGNEKMNQIEFEKDVYVFKDNSVNTTMHILPLYDYLNQSETVNTLYTNFISLEKQSSKSLLVGNKKAYKNHNGQMNNLFPLNPSQRECLTHFQVLKKGEILAVNGPPGTGKTTLLQTILANMLVEHALNKKDAPLVLGTSTNNQAVKNIISSFASSEAKEASIFENRWIYGVKSLALYMPSSTKIEEEHKNGVQVDNNFGKYFNTVVDCNENIERSKVLFLNSFQEYFEEDISRIEDVVEAIYNKLKEAEKFKYDYLEFIEKLSYEKVEPKSLAQLVTDIEQQIENEKERLQKYKARIDWWECFFATLPWWMRLFKFLNPVKKRIQNKCSREILDYEAFIKSKMRFFEIENAYTDQLDKVRDQIQAHNKKLVIYRTLKDELDRIHKQATINAFNIDLETYSLEKANISLDKSIRYHQFWLAVHYYEGLWLLNKNPIDLRSINTNYSNVIRQKMNRWAMITPFFVSTLFMMPSHFSGYVKDSETRDYLIDFIDLMIIDEAGQVSPEIASCSFALAQKALIVGDEKQIEPVYSVSKALDRALAVENHVMAESVEDVHDSLNCSESSVMRVASNRCDYEKYESKGLFLSEHRRCYDEIIQYCNKLMYNEYLIPMRGSSSKEDKYPSEIVRPMMHIQASTDYSTKSGNSRRNYNESLVIANWIKENFNALKRFYSEKDEKDIIAIITPFKAQVSQIKTSLKRVTPELANRISVGTVHTFQGAERPIIIFSTVYGSKDGGCYFIDTNPSMLNVAVSRAKDSFITIGDHGCLSDNLKMPSGLLKSLLSR